MTGLSMRTMSFDDRDCFATLQVAYTFSPGATESGPGPCHITCPIVSSSAIL